MSTPYRIMGVLNVTPDSFSDGGRLDPGAAVDHALRMIDEGAHIIDVGGESTRPGADPVPAEVEIARVVPVIRALAQRTRVPISIDTYKAATARAALDAGAGTVNDISALRFDPELVHVVRDADCDVILMHAAGDPKTMQRAPHYDDVVAQVRAHLHERTAFAEARGIARARITVDPGIGFGKTTAHNLSLLRALHTLAPAGVPLLLGASRKSFIGRILGSEAAPVPPEARLAGSLAAVAAAFARGVGYVRVHDVKPTADLLHLLAVVEDAP